MTPEAFIAKWTVNTCNERAAAEEHFIDICRLVGEPTSNDADPDGSHSAFEKGVLKSTGGNGWADVWKRHHFAIEYKGKHKEDNDASQVRMAALLGAGISMGCAEAHADDGKISGAGRSNRAAWSAAW